VAEVGSVIQARAATMSRDYATARARVAAMRSEGRLGEAEVEIFARAGKFEETAVALAIMSALPIEVVERAMAQDREEAILIIVKAAGLAWPAAKAVLLLCMEGRGGVATQTLEQCRTTFGRLKRETAQKVVAFQSARRA
jgi:hypothetical protein